MSKLRAVDWDAGFTAGYQAAVLHATGTEVPRSTLLKEPAFIALRGLKNPHREVKLVDPEADEPRA